MQGTVAHNLDPINAASDEARKTAIARARLPEDFLSLAVEKGGTNIASGERQLLCFARAILQPRPVLVLDEATSNLDAASDAAMQLLLRLLVILLLRWRLMWPVLHLIEPQLSLHRLLLNAPLLAHWPPAAMTSAAVHLGYAHMVVLVPSDLTRGMQRLNISIVGNAEIQVARVPVPRASVV